MTCQTVNRNETHSHWPRVMPLFLYTWLDNLGPNPISPGVLCIVQIPNCWRWRKVDHGKHTSVIDQLGYIQFNSPLFDTRKSTMWAKRHRSGPAPKTLAHCSNLGMFFFSQDIVEKCVCISNDSSDRYCFTHKDYTDFLIEFLCWITFLVRQTLLSVILNLLHN